MDQWSDGAMGKLARRAQSEATGGDARRSTSIISAWEPDSAGQLEELTERASQAAT
jgi:hypothetical protein